MSEFHQQSWGARYQRMGSTAETAFLEMYPHAHRLGIDRPDFPVSKLPAFYRQAPDFLLADGAYEVMGVSSRAKNPTLKLKFEKLQILELWDNFGNTYLWVWDSARKASTCARISVWSGLCHDYGTVERFDDNNKPYWSLPIERFPQVDR